MLISGSVEPLPTVIGPGKPGPWMVPITVAEIPIPTCDNVTAAWWLAKPRSEV